MRKLLVLAFTAGAVGLCVYLQAISSPKADETVKLRVRLVDAETEIRDEQDPLPTAYYTIWGYYGFVTVAERGPAFMTLDSKLQIEVNIYSLESEKLLWSGTTETMQPRLMETLVKDVADLISKRLKREGLLSASPAAT